ncbi:MAG TPA: trypsin-like peptidase domain-containing protein [Sedimentibacter sp.]|jgi:S1-C subfamily serine protease|nr:trypsin-like peptidase domain-containing protein [Sedimentibacter sp.]NLA13417.1 trypsin-like serine protease [Tissierellia bacterium]HOA19088.1 trypsin-like peptidase domain-containing protein [Sedimentibacter sp.]HOG62250.1 trypsin-like peptidase domain-containing protein [Sedimentibacter sp.]HOT22092.1 trypsin-like peptidase domain-containing protein [Sedimentibacter sp.]
MDFENNFNDNLEKENQNNITNDSMSNEYGEINFVMNEPLIKKPKKRRIKSVMGYIALVLVAAIIGGLTGSYVTANMLNAAAEKKAAESSINAQEVKINLTDDVYFAVAVAEKSQKTVVGITTEVERQINTFWGPQKRTEQHMGSGFIVDSNGYIVTNSHVIGDGNYKNITVSLIDGSIETGNVLWYDTNLDLAIVKINKTRLPAAELGNSDELMVGEPAVAIGNPMTLDLERTVTQGIISGLNRSIQFEDGTVIEPLIQTDASINSGNSGGPLFNAKGQVIGINTAKMTSAEGLGFAIPINIIKPVLTQVVTGGTFIPVYVGITGMDIETYEMLYGVDLMADYGVIIIETMKDSPAREAGLQPNDVIIEIDGKKTEYMVDIQKKLYEYQDGDKSEFKILRNGEELKLVLTLRNRPDGI